ncbi:DUF2782 domain-containing protein [Vogesella sp. LYT5W]|uniref:DUF2782 domain-containing protein n=1 Tax=Vogesella margarita TaxID=2984199 RepID=A0ABT5IJ55_9NEIS|nr:DUF2782 domain-containing protein [Vogesella margarita]MDC7712555.1 DUF2782 domain-containing protein [Vogesella margarita]
MSRLILAVLAAIALPALADTPAAVLPPPPTIAADAMAEPEVRIIQDGDNSIEEYRLNGRLYLMKVTPKNAPPYYLRDDEGNGQMKRIDPSQRLVVPQWVLLTF